VGKLYSLDSFRFKSNLELEIEQQAQIIAELNEMLDSCYRIEERCIKLIDKLEGISYSELEGI